MRARTVFIGSLALILAAPLASNAQQPAKGIRIGFLGATARTGANEHLFDAFRHGLRDLGYVEGQNIAIEWRFAEGRLDRFAHLAAELVNLQVRVIVATNQAAAEGAGQVIGATPIVIALGSDLVDAGSAKSLARPGGNITGLTVLAPELSGKRLELLKEVVPRASWVAALRNPTNPVSAGLLRETETAARALGVRLQIVEASRADEFDGAFAAMTKARAYALVLLPDAMFLGLRARLADLAAKRRLPAIDGPREFAEAGGLMAYGPSYAHLLRRAATYVDKILKGAKAGDLPIEQPTRFELVVNLKTAKALGITIPQSVLIRADQVIQ